MAVKSRKGKGAYKGYKEAGKYAKNRAAKAKAHAKRHPADEQSVKQAVQGYRRKKPMKKGAFPAANRNKLYRDASGKFVGAPEFAPTNK